MCECAWIHFIGGPGGDESGRDKLDGLESYLSGNDFALRSSTREKGGTGKRNRWA